MDIITILQEKDLKKLLNCGILHSYGYFQKVNISFINFYKRR